MKAVIVQGPGLVRVQEVPEPVIGDYDALCGMIAASVCGGTDNHAVEGAAYFRMRYPEMLGHEGIGRVIACGPRVRRLRAGDLVTRVVNRLPASSGITVRTGWGSFAERGIVTDWEAMREDGMSEDVWKPYRIHRVLPETTDPIAATMIITWRETLAFLSGASPKHGQRMLVIGSGGNALSFVEHGRNRGLHIAVIGSPARKDAFLSAGAACFLSYQTTDPAADLQALGFPRIDIIIDAIGRSATLNALLPLLAPDGTVGIYGLDEQPGYRIDPSRAPGPFTAIHASDYDESSAHEAVMADIAAGRLDAWRYLSRDHFYPLDRIADALQATKERKTLKSVIVF